MNVYQEARRSEELTQAEAASALYIGLRTLQSYEEGRITPSSDIVIRMVELYKAPWLGYRHLRESTALGRRVLPNLKSAGLCQTVLSLQKELADVQGLISKLIEIAADGEVGVSEEVMFRKIVKKSEEAAGALLALCYCKITD